MSLAERRQAIQSLLNERDVADATAVYFALYHPDERTRIVTWPASSGNANGYICIARTGIDLFRPLVTMRFPTMSGRADVDLGSSMTLIDEAIPIGSNIILSAPVKYRPLLTASFEIQTEQTLKLFQLDRERFKPLINVLVTKSAAHNNLPRYTIRQTAQKDSNDGGEIMASSGLNWQSARFAEIYVHTKSSHRRQGYGQSVVSRLVQDVLEYGRTPIYAVSVSNEPSVKLAQSIGFVDTGVEEILVEARRQPLR